MVVTLEIIFSLSDEIITKFEAQGGREILESLTDMNQVESLILKYLEGENDQENFVADYHH